MAKKQNAWTPYGLEAIRIAHLRRRRLVAIIIALALAGLWAAMFDSTTTNQLELSANGGGSQIDIDVSDSLNEKEDKPLTVGISPGRITRADTGASGDTAAQTARFAAPTFTRAPAIGWSSYAILYGPYVLIGLALYMLARRPPKHEVNFGIYKGALPYEMVTATASRFVFTTREARLSLFGKRRVDHLPPEVLIERMPVEEDN